MSGVMDTLISGIVKSAMNEILKKSGVKSSATKRTKRKARTAAPSPTSGNKKRKAGPVSGTGGRGSRATGTTRTPPKKQVSKRRTSAARSKTRR